MSATVKQFVRYWGFLLAKFLAAGCILATLIWSLNHFWPVRLLPVRGDLQRGYNTTYLGYLLCLGAIYLVGVALFYLSVLDQRYRCRVCLRRLRMPVETGSWSKMLQFGRPHMEYICIYGHGKLNIPELHLTGMDSTRWTEHSDYWAELCGTSDSSKSDR